MPNVSLSKNSEKEFGRLPKPEKKKVLKKLKSLRNTPFVGKPLTGELKNFFSIKAWPYRIIYEFDKNSNSINVHKIQHRQGVYKK